MRLHAARGQTLPDLRAYNQPALQETLANQFGSVLNSCRVVLATAGMVATRRRLMLGGPRVRHTLGNLLQFVLYRTRCTACFLTQQICMNLPLAMVVRGLFTGGSLCWYPPSSPAFCAGVGRSTHPHSQHR